MPQWPGTPDQRGIVLENTIPLAHGVTDVRTNAPAQAPTMPAQMPMVAPAAPPAPPAPPGRGGFNPRDLMILLGAVSTMRGNPGFAQGLVQSDQRAQQQALAEEDRRLRQQQFDAQQQSRAADDERAAREQRLRFIQSLPGFLGDEGIDSPEAFDQRFGVATNMGTQIGVDPGFLNTFRPKPDVFQQRKAKKKLADLAKTYSAAQLTQLEEMQPNGQPVATFEFDGQRVSLAQLRQMAGTAAMGPQGSPMALSTGPTKPRALQRTEALVNGRRTFVNYDPDDGKFYDANGQPVTNATPIPPVSAMPSPHGEATPKQIATFNQIAGAYERSPLIRAADRTIVLEDAVAAVRQNPNDAAAQLQMAYAFIQGLDTYQSAVREGELQNLGMLGTRLQNLAVEANRIASTGAFMPPDVAKQIADSSEQLVKTIKSGMLRKQKEFGSRARVSGVGGMWDQFIAGAQGAPSPSAGTPPPNPYRPRQ